MTRTCTNGLWCVSTTYGDGIDGYKLSAFIPHKGDRFANGKPRHQNGEGDRRVFKTGDEAWDYALEHGYTRPTGRNALRFVQSRAARRHGFVATDLFYTMRADRLNRKAD